ncbi:carbohydrate-binding protein [Amycolatopsis anabasis]|uniref:carbohydrate-binding protein n=1 Tax=Amycolatopsis anabasis TaxID=1840409 RepID=UPI00131E0F7E|nr:carbohydrate-binding protein [Amycolatopsis anabasis]
MRTIVRFAIIGSILILTNTGLAAAAGNPSGTTVSASGQVPGGPPSADNPAAAKFRELRRHGGPRASIAAQVHNFWGILPPNAGAGEGMTATHAVYPDLRITKSGDFLYSPTAKPGNGSCIEVVTSYSQAYGPQIWAWDWCRTGNLAKQTTVDTNFMNTYTTTVNGHAAYTVRNEKTDAGSNGWTASLFNYRTNAWDVYFTSSGSDKSNATYGWDVFEIYSSPNPSTGTGYYCSASVGKPFESNDIKLRKGGSWVPASASDSPFVPPNPAPEDYQCPNLKFQVVHANDHWIVRQ